MRIEVLYWYQLGDHIIFDRSDLENVRAELKGQEPQPRLIKVQLQIERSADDDNKDRLLELASKIAKWLDTPFYDPRD